MNTRQNFVQTEDKLKIIKRSITELFSSSSKTVSHLEFKFRNHKTIHNNLIHICQVTLADKDEEAICKPTRQGHIQNET